MMPTDRLREELCRAKCAAATMAPSTAADRLRETIERIERRLAR